jgi:hypothetical protein
MDFFFRAADHRFKDADLRERPSEPGQHLVRALLMAIQLLPVGILMRWRRILIPGPSRRDTSRRTRPVMQSRLCLRLRRQSIRRPLREHCSRAWRTLVHIEIPADDEVS